MSFLAKLEKLPSTGVRLRAGVALIGLALPISFYNAVSAGFFFVAGLLSCLTLVVDWQRLKSLNVSFTSVSAEMFEKIERKVEDAEGILAEIRQVEARISYILTEQVLNRGGEKYLGGFGEEAEIAIFKALRETKAAKDDPAVAANLNDLKTRLALGLCHGLFGSKWSDKNSALFEFLMSTSYKVIPTIQQVHEMATRDEVDLTRDPNLLEAYRQFVEEDIAPSDEIAASLYKNKVHGEEWEDA